MWFFSKYLLKIFDSKNQRKIYTFIKNKLGKKLHLVLDVGAHRGETINILNDYFDIKNIYGFEPSKFNFLKLKEFISKENIQNTKIFNFACGSVNKSEILNYSAESSSSTIRKVDENSKYFKKKKFFIQGFSKNNFFESEKIEIKKLDDFLNLNKVIFIDLIKIDTEGYELEVLKGLSKNLENTKMIYFEHHYDNMIQKNYTFTDINNFLKKSNFKNIYKIKMPFRKTFEYIYINQKSYEKEN
tara:strand:- start:473 stop:1201 length:729 start_codon:yes stop_codon:yes gene_type:complete